MTTTTAEVKRPVQDAGAAEIASRMSEREPVMLRKRIGSTLYLVNIRYSPSATETIQDKLLRLMESEVRTSA
jgi:hypothetical protein